MCIKLDRSAHIHTSTKLVDRMDSEQRPPNLGSTTKKTKTILRSRIYERKRLMVLQNTKLRYIRTYDGRITGYEVFCTENPTTVFSFVFRSRGPGCSLATVTRSKYRNYLSIYKRLILVLQHYGWIIDSWTEKLVTLLILYTYTRRAFPMAHSYQF